MTQGRWPVLTAFIATIAVAALIRVAAQVELGFYDHPESWEQDVVARSVANGNGFQIEYHGTTYYALVHPVDPLLFAAAYKVFGQTPIVGGILLVVIGSGVAAGAFVLCRSAGLSLATATVAGLLVATHPGLIVYSAKLHPLELDALVLVLLTIAIYVMHRPTNRRTIMTGVLLGITALERLSFVPFALLSLAFTALRRPIDRARVVAVLSALALAMVMALPWSTRNVLTIGSPVIVSTGGLQLWLGNNPVASGSALLPSGASVFESAPDIKGLVWGRPEIEQDRILEDAAIEYIATDPGAALQRTWGKFVSFWWASRTTGLEYPAGWARAYLVYWAVILVAAAAGVYALVQHRTWRLLGFVLFALLSVSVVHAITYVEGRHRWAVEPLVLVLAAAGITEIAATMWRIVRKPSPILPR